MAELREIEVKIVQGKDVLTACRQAGATDKSYYRCRREYGGMMVDQAKRLKPITAHAYPPRVWSPGEVVVDHVQISAANLPAGSYAAWMGMYSPSTQVRATIAAETVVVSGHRPPIGVSDSALIMSSAAGMPGVIAVRSCGAKRAAVYQRRRPERTAAYQVVLIIRALTEIPTAGRDPQKPQPSPLRR